MRAFAQRLELPSVSRAHTRWEKSYVMGLPRLLRLTDERRKSEAARMTASPIRRMGTSVADGWREV